MNDPPIPKADAMSASTASIVLTEQSTCNVSRESARVIANDAGVDPLLPPPASVPADDLEGPAPNGPEVLEELDELRRDDRRVVLVAGMPEPTASELGAAEMRREVTHVDGG